MKKTLSLLIITLLVNFTFAQDVINFTKTSYEQLLKKSKVDQKAIMLFFSVDSKECTSFEKSFFSQSKLAGFYNHNFYNVKPVMSSASTKNLAKKFNVNSYPSIVFVNSKQVVIHKIVGINHQIDGLKLGENVKSGKNTLLSYSTAFKKSKNPDEKDPTFLLDYANILYEANEDYSMPIKLYFESLQEERMNEPMNLLAIMRYSNDIYAPEFKYFVNHISDLEIPTYQLIDKYLKLEDVISGHIMNAIKTGKSVILSDTLSRVFEYLQIDGEENIIITARLNMEYYRDVEKIKNEEYFKYMNEYLAFRISFLSPLEVGDYCSEIYRFNNDEELNRQALMWIEEACNRERSLDLSYIKLQLMIKDGRQNEVNDQLPMIKEEFREEMDPAWEVKLDKLALIIKPAPAPTQDGDEPVKAPK